ncbi:hypothetical protein HY969_04005 [Candidatus Kaiserbacteria bacterium]|nr:hypothetical protein [Candidatus Kaiserbacteria bacterium]
MRGRVIHLKYRLLSSLLCVFFCVPLFLAAEEIQSGSTALSTRIAPGESLPIQIKLLNFGRNERVDVSILYDIRAQNGTTVVTYREVVALETSASFIHNIDLPDNIASGTYLARTTVSYNGQESPAIASYQFAVERKFAGIFVSNLLAYALICLFTALATAALFAAARKFNHASRHFAHSFDYSHVAHAERIYYEIVSDMVQQMRLHEGARALAMTNGIEGLSIDGEGRILNITGDPAAVVAVLVAKYEARFGRKMSFSFPHSARAHTLVKS